MNDISNLSDTIIPNSQQLNADQLLGGPITISVTNVKRGSDDQPIAIYFTGDNGKPYLPCKTCRKVLIFAWGDDGREWVGRSMTLYNNPDVKFGGVKVGGIRISHLSHVERDIALALTATKGKKESYVIKKLEAPVEHPVFAKIRAAMSLQDLEALRPEMKGVDGSIAAAKHRAEVIRAADSIPAQA